MGDSVLTPETVQRLREAGGKDLLWLLCASHEALRAQRDEARRRADWLWQDADEKQRHLDRIRREVTNG